MSSGNEAPLLKCRRNIDQYFTSILNIRWQKVAFVTSLHTSNIAFSFSVTIQHFFSAIPAMLSMKINKSYHRVITSWRSYSDLLCWIWMDDGNYVAMCHSHDDVIKWKHFPFYWPFVRGIHLSPVNSPHKNQWRGDLTFSLICAWINDWVNNRKAGDLRRHRSHCDVGDQTEIFRYK